jgi:UDP-N-acetylglucosamine--N-acetylmuramyl-(pentapeptide) pyrophosphoryl-undecaprenol N-acetylglucosamine transferase
MEAGLVARESRLTFQAVPAAAVRGRSPLALARNSAVLARGVLAARRLIAAAQPAAILGTGGYVCVPVFLAARAAGVPTLLFLPDVVPGLAVRFLSRVASATACSVIDSARYLGPHIHATGYPTRRALFKLEKPACRAAFGLNAELPIVLVYGGSRGARTINRAIAALLPQLLELAQLIHVCGREGDEEFLKEAMERLPKRLHTRYRLFPYLHSGDGDTAASMLAAFGAADLVISRSGASALGELPAAGLPAVLVPYPYVHQDENADYLVHAGAAIKVADQQLLEGERMDDGLLFRTVRRLLTDPEERERMAASSRALARPDAAERLAHLLLALASGRALHDHN